MNLTPQQATSLRAVVEEMKNEQPPAHFTTAIVDRQKFNDWIFELERLFDEPTESPCNVCKQDGENATCQAVDCTKNNVSMFGPKE